MARKEFEVLTPQMFYILLVLNKPMHGYEIMNKINELTNGKIKVGAGTLYALLARFENEGYIQLKSHTDRKKIYQITKEGVNKLIEESNKLQIMLLHYKEVYGDEKV